MFQLVNLGVDLTVHYKLKVVGNGADFFPFSMSTDYLGPTDQGFCFYMKLCIFEIL